MIGDIGEAVEYLRPKPSPYRLVRVGPSRDGGYLLPSDFSGIEHCFSPGVDNRKLFEDSLVVDFGINAHMADFSSNESSFESDLVAGRQTFLKKWISAEESEDSVTLPNWVTSVLGHDSGDSSDLLMQMDIEGAEYDVISALDDSFLRRFRIIAIELHHLGRLLEASKDSEKILFLLNKISGLFTVVHAHPNNCGRVFRVPGLRGQIPEMLEVTLLRNDRFTQIDPSEFFEPEIPSHLDIPFNCGARPPIHLEGEWLASRRTFRSVAKKFSNYAVFLPALLLFWLKFFMRIIKVGVRARR